MPRRYRRWVIGFGLTFFFDFHDRLSSCFASIGRAAVVRVIVVARWNGCEDHRGIELVAGKRYSAVTCVIALDAVVQSAIQWTTIRNACAGATRILCATVHDEVSHELHGSVASLRCCVAFVISRCFNSLAPVRKACVEPTASWIEAGVWSQLPDCSDAWAKAVFKRKVIDGIVCTNGHRPGDFAEVGISVSRRMTEIARGVFEVVVDAVGAEVATGGHALAESAGVGRVDLKIVWVDVIGEHIRGGG